MKNYIKNDIKKGTQTSAFFVPFRLLHFCNVLSECVEDYVKTVCACIGITD